MPIPIRKGLAAHGLATALLAAGCGGGSTPQTDIAGTPAEGRAQALSATPAGTAARLEPVAATDSPLPGLRGVKAALGRSTVYLLSREPAPGLRIAVQTADAAWRDELLEGRVFSVDGMARAADLVFVATDTPVKDVYRCRWAERRCTELPVQRTPAGIAFVASADGVYALRK